MAQFFAVCLICALWLQVSCVPWNFRIGGVTPGEALDIRDFRMLHPNAPPELDGLEIFSGSGMMTRVAQEAGLRWASFDKKNPSQDITTSDGWDILTDLLYKVKERGVVWLAPECSNFVFASSSHHQRLTVGPHRLAHPGRVEGNQANERVRDANFIARRVAWVWCLAANVRTFSLSERAPTCEAL